MRAHLKYLSYVLRHKWYVFAECCKLGIPLQGIIHDWSKFLPSEWFPYVAYFYGGPHRSLAEFSGYEKAYFWDAVRRVSKEEVGQRFDLAWLLHQKRNPHHWQFWVLMEDSPSARYLVQAMQPEVGPYYLFDVQREKQVAEFGFGFNCEDGCSDEVFRAMVDVERALAVANPKVLPMPDRYRREMLADWKGAGLAMGKPDTAAWYRANRHKMLLHPETRAWVEAQLGVAVSPAGSN